MSDTNQYPVDSATRACCGGIGGHTRVCAEAELIHPAGPFPAIRPVVCAPWCSDSDGHTSSVLRADQNCWGESHYVELSLEEVSFEHDGSGSRKIWPSIIGPNAYRGHNEHPCVYLHFMLQDHGGGDLLDGSCKLTAAEARQLAEHLITVANEIEAAR